MCSRYRSWYDALLKKVLISTLYFVSNDSISENAKKLLEHSVLHVHVLTWHQYADNGPPLEEAAALVADIQEEFRLGTDTLHPDDHHFLATNAADILSRSVSYQLAWRRGVQNARRTYERRTASSLARMQATMRLWLDRPG